jgi:hypothetical protein
VNRQELPLPPLDTHRLAGLVFELASQLHAERLHRLTLEAALMSAGVLDARSLEAAARDSAIQRRGETAVGDSVARLMRVIAEWPDARAPLRAAADEDSRGAAARDGSLDRG